MENFPPNSSKAAANAQPERPKNIERVTSGEAVRRKKGLGSKFKHVFIAGDSKSAVSYVLDSVVVPTLRTMLSEALQGGLDRWIHGESRPRRTAPPGNYSNVGHFDYRMASGGGPQRPPQPQTISRAARARHSFDDIVIPSRQEAEEVIDRLFDLVNNHGSASVGDLYELTGIQGTHTDEKWGWTQLRGARAARMRTGGFLLELPEPQPFN